MDTAPGTSRLKRRGGWKRALWPKRWGGRVRRIVLALALLVAIGAWAVLRGPIAKRIVVAKLEEALGAEVEVRRVALGLDGRIRVRGLVVRAPGIPGLGGEVLRAGWTEVELAQGKPRSVELRGGALRLSESRDDASWNVEALGAFTREGAGGTTPRIEVKNFAIEIAEHGAQGFELLSSMPVEGVVRAGDAGEAIVELRETETGAQVQGTFQKGRIQAVVEGLDLSRWSAERLPRRLRGMYRESALAGKVGRVEIELDERGVSVEAVLEGVDVTLPFNAEGEYAGAGPRARMRGVTGRIEITPEGVNADLKGLLEDLPYEATLRYGGLTEQEPFWCELRTRDYLLSSDPALVPLLPPVVAERLENFTQPTGKLDARVALQRWRNRDGSLSPIDVRGWLRIEEGVASFSNFPYEFRDLEGQVYFDTSVLIIEEISGVAPTGARLTASGEIWPLHEDAAVDLHVRVTDVPIDETLKAGLKERRKVVDELFSQAWAERLEAQGLLAEGEFEVGGVGDLDVYVWRALGSGTEWEWVVRAELPTVAMMPQAFPYPIVGHDIVLRVTNDESRLVQGTFKGLSGGEAVVTVAAGEKRTQEGPKDAEGEQAQDKSTSGLSNMTVGVMARGVPLDERLVFAVRHAAGGDREEAERLWRELGLTGVVDSDVRIASGEEGMDVSGTAWIAGRGTPRTEGVTLEELNAAVRLGDEVALDASGWIEDGEMRSEITVHSTLGECIEARVEAAGVDARMRIENVVGVFSEDGAEQIARLRAEHAPEGMADVLVEAGCGEEGRDVAIGLEARGRVGADTKWGRAWAELDRGRVVVHPGEKIVLDGLEGMSGFEDGSVGRVFASGEVDYAGSGRFAIEARGARVESTAVQMILEQLGGSGAAEALAGIKGEMDVEAEIEIDQGGMKARGTVMPRELDVAREGVVVEMQEIAGGIEFDEGGALAVDMAAEGDGWNGEVRGEYADGLFEGAVDLYAGSLTEEVRLLLPAGVRKAASAMKLEVAGPIIVSLNDLRIGEEQPEAEDEAGNGKASVEEAKDSIGDGGDPPFEASGTVLFTDARFDAALEVRRASGGLTFEARSDRGEQADAQVRVGFDRLVGGGVTMAAGLGDVEIYQGGRDVLAALEAHCHGGRVAGEVDARVAEGTYQALVSASGVRLASLISDLDEENPGFAPPGAEPDDSRGRISGELTLAGELDGADGRRGRGTLQVGEGSVVGMPLLLPLIQVTNLQLPSTGRVDLALLSFFIQDKTVTFDELSAFADTVEVFGYGQMDWETRELDLWFSSRSVRPLPILSGLIEDLRNELITAHVTGPLGEQTISTSTLRGTRQFFGRLLGRQRSSQEERLAQIAERGRENRERVRQSGERVRNLAEREPVRGNTQP